MIETEIFNRDALSIIIDHFLMVKELSWSFKAPTGAIKYSSNADPRPSGSNMSGALNPNFIGSDSARCTVGA